MSRPARPRWHWWLISGAVSAATAAATPAPPAAPPPPAPAPRPAPPPSDESFIEFLGADDVGDAGWWEFLKKTDPHANTPPPPSAGTKQ